MVLPQERLYVKAARLQIHTFHKKRKMHRKVKHCEMNEDCNFHISNSTNNPCKLTKRAKNMQK
jgi:hypothetical protein